MKAKLSQLKLIEFSLMDFYCRCEFPLPEKGMQGLFDDYDIDLDYGIKKITSNKHFYVYIKVNINRGINSEVKPGYSIYAEGVGIFNIENETDAGAESWYSSAVSMCLSYLRANIANISAAFPVGKYLLPSIDMHQLSLDKQRQGADVPERKSSRRKKKSNEK